MMQHIDEMRHQSKVIRPVLGLFKSESFGSTTLVCWPNGIFANGPATDEDQGRPQLMHSLPTKNHHFHSVLCITWGRVHLAAFKLKLGATGFRVAIPSLCNDVTPRETPNRNKLNPPTDGYGHGTGQIHWFVGVDITCTMLIHR